MSDLRVALVAEGPTDAVVVEAALKALLPRPFKLSLLQPEETRPKLGAGWGGVLRWCHDFAGRDPAGFEDDPTLPGFDLFILHIDADVADMAYTDIGAAVAAMATEHGWPALPNPHPCPPAATSAEVMRGCLLVWAGMTAPGSKTALCVTSKAVEAWLTAALFEEGHPLLKNIECNRNLERELRRLPKAQRIKKTTRQYLAHAPQITRAWSTVRERCPQAARFSNDVEAVLAKRGL